MPLQTTVAPVKEPVTLAEAKAWARVDTSDDDALVTAMIKAARGFAETKTRRSLITQTIVLTLDSFPGPSVLAVSWDRPYSIPEFAILLERPPVQSIASIAYTAMDGTNQVMSTADFVDLTNGGAQRVDDVVRITPKFGKIWPINLPQIGSVRVTYVAGYGVDGTTVPDEILTWMKLRLAALYENREEVVVGSRIVVAELPYIDSLLDPYIVELF